VKALLIDRPGHARVAAVAKPEPAADVVLYFLDERLRGRVSRLKTPERLNDGAAGTELADAMIKLGAALGVKVVAEGIEHGTQYAKARQLGMNSTTFRNAHGLPNNQQVTTARDMAILGLAVREHFPQHYHYFNTRQFNFAGQSIRNHNRLLGRVTGVDGIKTGFIRASGFNLVTSVRTGGRSVVAVVMGGRTGASRDDHMAALIREHLPRASTRQPSQPLRGRRKSTTGRVKLPPRLRAAHGRTRSRDLRGLDLLDERPDGDRQRRRPPLRRRWRSARHPRRAAVGRVAQEALPRHHRSDHRSAVTSNDDFQGSRAFSYEGDRVDYPRMLEDLRGPSQPRPA
jgi:hypothetical protein